MRNVNMNLFIDTISACLQVQFNKLYAAFPHVATKLVLLPWRMLSYITLRGRIKGAGVTVYRIQSQ